MKILVISMQNDKNRKTNVSEVSNSASEHACKQDVSEPTGDFVTAAVYKPIIVHNEMFNFKIYQYASKNLREQSSLSIFQKINKEMRFLASLPVFFFINLNILKYLLLQDEMKIPNFHNYSLQNYNCFEAFNLKYFTVACKMIALLLDLIFYKN